MRLPLHFHDWHYPITTMGEIRICKRCARWQRWISTRYVWQGRP